MLPPGVDPEDPQKGRFGGVPERDGRRLTARVKTLGDDWFELTLTVESTALPDAPLRFRMS
jgi:hypothetical protein